jgi:hypothetical protein
MNETESAEAGGKRKAVNNRMLTPLVQDQDCDDFL